MNKILAVQKFQSQEHIQAKVPEVVSFFLRACQGVPVVLYVLRQVFPITILYLWYLERVRVWPYNKSDEGGLVGKDELFLVMNKVRVAKVMSISCCQFTISGYVQIFTLFGFRALEVVRL